METPCSYCSYLKTKKKQNKTKKPLVLWRTWGVVCILITQRWTLSQLQVESGTAISIHCYLVFQWSCEHFELVRNFLSLAARKEVLMPRDGTGNDRISPMTLYGVFLKNKVNKTWDAEPQILISCLWLWGGGCGVMQQEGVRARHGQGSEEWKWVGKEKTGGGRMFWCFCNSLTSVRCRCLRGKSSAAFSDDRGRSRKEAGCYKPQQCTECVKTLQSKNNVTAMHRSPVSLCNVITASLV